MIVGNALGNRIKGLGGKDVVCSLGGADRVDPGKGKDRVDAGAGLDRVDLVDGARDTVSCGSGKRDRVSLDESDRARKCEVKRESAQSSRPRPARRARIAASARSVAPSLDTTVDTWLRTVLSDR